MLRPANGRSSRSSNHTRINHLLPLKKRLLIFFLYTVSAFAQQKDIRLFFSPVAREKIVALNDSIELKGHERIVLETLRFYISGIRLLQNDSLVWKEGNSYHLYDLEEARGIVLKVPASVTYNRIRFYTGIDSLTNVSGAMGGDLDPVKGMYWTWQSGYINFKAEGRSTASTHPGKEFQLHLGGYEGPYNTLRQVTLSVEPQRDIDVNFDLQQFLEAAELAKRSHLMSPGPDAVSLSVMASLCFKTKQR